MFSLPDDLAIDEALKRLDDAGYSGAPVVSDGKVLGVRSEVDCARVMATAAFHAAPVGSVADHMSGDVDTLTVRGLLTQCLKRVWQAPRVLGHNCSSA